MAEVHAGDAVQAEVHPHEQKCSLDPGNRLRDVANGLQSNLRIQELHLLMSNIVLEVYQCQSKYCC